jgi:hypothetical protein
MAKSYGGLGPCFLITLQCYLIFAENSNGHDFPKATQCQRVVLPKAPVLCWQPLLDLFSFNLAGDSMWVMHQSLEDISTST